MDYKKYQHVERLGTDAVEGILDGEVFVFPKLDGTNMTIFLGDDGEVKAGSRNRQLSLGWDNAGSYAYVLGEEKFKKYLEKHPTHRLYGEFLVRHTIKDYEDDSWRKLYIFDIIDEDGTPGGRYIPFPEYEPLLKEFGIEFIPPITRVSNATIDDIVALSDQATYLMKDGKAGEGVVVKRYDFVNKYGHRIWGKYVRPQVKLSQKIKKPTDATSVEQLIMDEFFTEEFIKKEHAKIVNENDGKWESKLCGKLIGVTWHTFIQEECWNIIKKYKKPVIDFGVLNKMAVDKIKVTMPTLF